ncbi:MAG: carbamoyl-phosphate synthase domain-containing protein, partial [Thermoguttaceae bacterium]
MQLNIKNDTPGFIALEDGSVYQGIGFGHTGAANGEIVFNTSMTGYQEVLTDPSYAGQIVMMTHPHIGNTGINSTDNEAPKTWVRGFIVREYCRNSYHQQSIYSLQQYLRNNKVVAVSEVDTRAITRRIRNLGAMKAVIASGD